MPRTAPHPRLPDLQSVSKRPVLAVETDGYQFHKQGTRQSERDRMKDRILDRYGLPLLRLYYGHRRRSENQRSIIEDCLNPAVISLSEPND